MNGLIFGIILIVVGTSLHILSRYMRNKQHK
jgi:hypothetical protein